MTYQNNVVTTIHGELMATVVPRNKQARRAHKEQTIPNAKHINKLIKYWNRASAK